ncbi:MAG: CcmD family protein [candidate division KSB1 bacterium]|nr:CcmD family protein [candidate division KSB1 bacterium]MDZ7407769.1 CcmD family protein [candidate division KSB1 bacterium]
MTIVWGATTLLLQTPASNPARNLNFLFAGFVVVWLLILGYLFSISRRQKRLEQEIATLRQMHEEK